MHVIGHDSDIVVGLQLVGEGIGGVAHVIDEVITGRGKLYEQDGGNGRLDLCKGGDLLRLAVLEDAEVFLLEVGDELVRLFQENAYIDGDHRDIDVQGEGRHAGRALDSGLGRRRRSGLLLLLLFGNGDGAIVAGRASGLGSGLVLSLLLRAGLLRAGGRSGSVGRERESGTGPGAERRQGLLRRYSS